MAVDTLIDGREPEVDNHPAGRSKRRWLWIGVLVAFALFATTLGIITSNEVRTNTQFDQTHRSLDITRAHTQSVVTNLGTVRQELAGVNLQVFLTTKALAQDAADLGTAQSELANAQSDISQQTTIIADLQTCLSGVQEALNALAVADQTRAIDALNSVTSSCSSVVAADG
jgi:hypothetical protein